MVKRQSTFLDAGTVTSAVVNFPVPVAAQSLLFCCVRNHGTTAPTNVTDTLGQTWIQSVVQLQAADPFMLSLWYVPNSAAGADAVTVTLSALNSLRIIILEYGGMNTTLPFDASSSAQVNAVTTLNSGNVLTSQAADLLLCLFANSGTATMLADPAFTQQEVVVPGANAGVFQVSDRLVFTPAVYSANPSQNNVSNLAVILAAYKGLIVTPDVLTGFGRRAVGYYEV